MSKLFFDHLVEMKTLDNLIKESVESLEEKQELWQVVDEMVHHRVLTCVLDCLDHEHHHDFLCLFHATPHKSTVIEFVNHRIDDDIEELIIKEINQLEEEISTLFGQRKEKKDKR